MNPKNDEKVSKDTNNLFLNLGKKTVDISKQAASSVQKGIENIVEQTKQNLHEKKVKKYNPLFPDDFRSDNFHTPNIIRIVDDAVRKNIDICEGAIGWIECVNEAEVLNLYDEWVEESGLQFVPMWKCDNIYCVDAFNRKRFININSIFTKATEEKMAELENIAYCLGAKSCSVEIVEMDKQINASSAKLKLKTPSMIKADNEFSISSKNSNSQSGKVATKFEGHRRPVQPQLKWFAHDDNIKGLIEMRCNKVRSIKSKVLELNGASSATMDKKTACTIDKLLKIGGSISMEKQALKEHSSVLMFEIVF